MRTDIARIVTVTWLAIAALCPAAASAQITPLSVPDLPQTIPLFPLPNVAVLPYLELPLHVFEPRYREMLRDALAGDRVIGMVQIQPGFERDYEGRPPIFGIGVAGVVVRSDIQSNGESDIVVRGFVKFRITSEIDGKAYRVARVEPITETVDEPALATLKAERPALEAAFAASLGVEPGSLRLPSMSDADLVSALVMNADFDTVDRQVLIEQPGVVARARKLVELLQNQARPERRR